MQDILSLGHFLTCVIGHLLLDILLVSNCYYKEHYWNILYIGFLLNLFSNRMASQLHISIFNFPQLNFSIFLMEKWSNLEVSILKTEVFKKNSRHFQNSIRKVFRVVSSADETIGNCAHARLCVEKLETVTAVVYIPQA